MPVPDETIWKKRFHLFMAVRLAGLATFLFGVAVAVSDLLRPGGWPALGAVIALVGVIDSVLAPRLLKRHWDREDAA
jgi:hypothetical protein